MTFFNWLLLPNVTMTGFSCRKKLTYWGFCMSVAIIINQYSIKYCKAIHSWKLSIRSLWCTVYVSFTCLKGLSTESNSICQFCFAGNTPLFWNFYTLIVMKLCIALFFKIDAVCNIQRVSSHAMLNVYHCKAKPLTFSFVIRLAAFS